MELKGKTIIVTGASSGIGASAATLFAAEGANLVLTARRRHELDALAASIDRDGGRAVVLAGDVRDEGHADALADLALREFGALDGAFNNAGIVGRMGPVPEMEPGNWQDVIAVNLTAAFLAAKAQIPAMRKGGGGSIVFTSSFVGFSNGGMPGMGAYAASKAGMIGWCGRWQRTMPPRASASTRCCRAARSRRAAARETRMCWISSPACIR